MQSLLAFCSFLVFSFGEGNDTPLQYSCLENPIDGGAWWATVHGFRKSWTKLSTHTHNYTHTYTQYVGYTLKKNFCSLFLWNTNVTGTLFLPNSDDATSLRHRLFWVTKQKVENLAKRKQTMHWAPITWITMISFKGAINKNKNILLLEK